MVCLELDVPECKFRLTFKKDNALCIIGKEGAGSFMLWKAHLYEYFCFIVVFGCI